MHICVFSSANSIDFAIFVEKSAKILILKNFKEKKKKKLVINYQLVIFECYL
jgi:hypothetical protein